MLNTDLPRRWMWMGIILISITGVIHLLGVADSLEEATYKGVLFLLNGIGSLVAAWGIYKGVKSWGWSLGLVITAATVLAYISSRTIGLPGLEAEPDAWFEPLGIISLLVEACFTILAVWVLTRVQASPVQRPSLSR